MTIPHAPEPRSLLQHFVRSVWEGAGLALGCFGLLILTGLALGFVTAFATALWLFGG